MIRVSALWYNKHFDGKIKVLLISSDEASKAKAINEGIPTMSCKYLIVRNLKVKISQNKYNFIFSGTICKRIK